MSEFVCIAVCSITIYYIVHLGHCMSNWILLILYHTICKHIKYTKFVQKNKTNSLKDILYYTIVQTNVISIKFKML